MVEPLLIRVEEAAELLGIGRSKVYEMLATGELASVRIGRSRRIPIAVIYTWIEAHIEGQVHLAA